MHKAAIERNFNLTIMILGLDGDCAHTYMKPITSSNNISWHTCRFPHQIKEKEEKTISRFFLSSHTNTLKKILQYFNPTDL